VTGTVYTSLHNYPFFGKYYKGDFYVDRMGSGFDECGKSEGNC
jgi:hypothetical protein